MNRIFREKQADNFTILPNAIFKTGLSLKAIGLLTYILHLPPDWVIVKTQLYKAMENDGRQSIDSAWKELADAGFIKTKKQYGPKGNLPIISYYVYDSPQKVADSQHADFQHADSTHAGFTQPKTRVRKTSHVLSTDTKSTIEQSTIPLMSNDINGAPGPEPAQDKQPEQPNTPHDPAPPPQDEKLKTVYPRFIAIYDTWFKGFHDGVPPNYANGNGNAAKALILYFKKIAGERSKKDGIVLDEAGLEAKALEGWQYVLNSWGKLDNFLQAKTRLVDINSNVQNIITQIKNGHSKTNTSNGKRATGGDVSINDLAGKVAAFTAANGNR